MMMNIHNSPTSSSSSDHLTPPITTTKNCDDQEMISGEFFRTTLHHYDDDDKNLPKKMMMMNPRKKRTKMIRIDNAASTSANVGAAPKPKYYKKPDPSAPKITRPCTECGKRFWSVKALFGHMRCHPERQWRGINPPPNLRRSSTSDHHRDDRVSLVTEEDQQVASYLLMLANAPSPCNAVVSASTSMNTNYTVGVSHSGTRDQNVVFGCQEIGNPVMDDHGAGPSGVNSFKFECSSCKKVFGSHQALGGHRASHKNVKGCFAINKSIDGTAEDDYNILGAGHDHRNMDQSGHQCGDQDKILMALGHKCSICLRVFSSGQALGGHKRCHWEKGDEPSSLTLGAPGPHQHCAAKGASALDLNLPVPHEDDHSSSTLTSGLSLDLRLGL